MGIFKKSGSKSKKPFYKKIWFWVVAVLAVSAIGGTGDSDTTDYDTSDIESAIIESVDDIDFSKDSTAQDEVILDFENDSTDEVADKATDEVIDDDVVVEKEDVVVETNDSPAPPPEAPPEDKPVETPSEPASPPPSSSGSSSSSSGGGTSVDAPSHDIAGENLVWVPVHGGTKYHSKSSCSNMEDPCQIPLDDAKLRGYTACKRCH